MSAQLSSISFLMKARYSGNWSTRSPSMSTATSAACSSFEAFSVKGTSSFSIPVISVHERSPDWSLSNTSKSFRNSFTSAWEKPAAWMASRSAWMMMLWRSSCTMRIIDRNSSKLSSSSLFSSTSSSMAFARLCVPTSVRMLGKSSSMNLARFPFLMRPVFSGSCFWNCLVSLRISGSVKPWFFRHRSRRSTRRLSTSSVNFQTSSLLG
mmetsp:Transcript_10062/g.29745  ORF Transcript_10062/g.29745 Transcript_10062/m.29745 type:complete len:209 (-) Transcript_10062:2717-3343(-)